MRCDRIILYNQNTFIISIRLEHLPILLAILSFTSSITNRKMGINKEYCIFICIKVKQIIGQNLISYFSAVSHVGTANLF